MGAVAVQQLLRDQSADIGSAHTDALADTIPGDLVVEEGKDSAAVVDHVRERLSGISQNRDVVNQLADGNDQALRTCLGGLRSELMLSRSGLNTSGHVVTVPPVQVAPKAEPAAEETAPDGDAAAADQQEESTE